jgi:hypothetical protein
VVLVLGWWTAGTGTAQAGDYQTVNDGNGLLADCGDTAGFNSGVCRGYFSGVDDTVSGILVCRPPESTNGQMVDVVLAGLRNHPEERHMASSYLVLKYLMAAFPCPKKQ